MNNNRMTAEEIIKAIQGMENGERIKLLIYLNEKHFGGTPLIEEIIELNYKALHGDD